MVMTPRASLPRPVGTVGGYPALACSWTACAGDSWIRCLILSGVKLKLWLGSTKVPQNHAFRAPQIPDEVGLSSYKRIILNFLPYDEHAFPGILHHIVIAIPRHCVRANVRVLIGVRR